MGIEKKEPADFNPSVEIPSKVDSFRFWCQKVLPLVYDDSLSYYELLCKVVNYLNNTIADVNTLGTDVDNLNKAYNELQSYVNDYFSTLDVQDEINNKLDTMAQDGSLSSLIQPLFDTYKTEINNEVNQQNNKITVLENRMNTFTSLPSGSTSGDAELIDIRVPASGFNNNTAYPNAGDAVRGQVSSLKEEIVNLKECNLFSTGRTGYILLADNTEDAASWGLYSDYIPVKPYHRYFIKNTIGNSVRNSSFNSYDKNYNFIQPNVLIGQDVVSGYYDCPPNTHYIRVNGTTSYSVEVYEVKKMLNMSVVGLNEKINVSKTFNIINDNKSHYWGSLIRVDDKIDNALGRYYFYYSTDHKGTDGYVSMAYTNDLVNYTIYGQVFKNGNFETETPSVLWSEKLNRFIMYFHSAGYYDGENQTTLLTSSVNGIEWSTTVKKAFDIDMERVCGDGHNGYFIPFKISNCWVGYSLLGGSDYSNFAIHYSEDGVNWITDHNQLGYWGYGDNKAIYESAGGLIYKNNQLYFIGMYGTFSSGVGEKEAYVGIVPMQDLYTPIGKPEKLFDLTDSKYESTNLRSVTVFQENNTIIVYYQCDNYINQAVIDL